MTEQSNRHAPVVTLTVGLMESGRTLNLQLKAKRGRGKTAHIHIERSRSWSDQDRRVIRGKAHKLLWSAPGL
ncbi:hypothetical protein [Deinococcus marmoris]|uniref:Uncharacterized protein n=1 Tax=Deinococcus marmoris TaxID=249408 RepID=A0A1U7P1W6_9DEIO|nr:hypothetical protein [Deinococcus marmoris]OLV19156.1 hypothetical protein BOO71_0003544 [Deinococcus marmoris]